MCGIAAILLAVRGESLRPDASERIRRMSRSMAHRGPDGEGVHEGRFAQLGHRRLSIIDIEGGAQPMLDVSGRYAVVFNGEIYNHAELRKRLVDKGHVFRTRCDTEVLLLGYREWGIGLPDRLRGMFAFVVHDLETGQSLIARDPLGQKPLYYTVQGPELWLASETRAFLGEREFRGSVDAAALRELLALRYVPGNRSLYGSICELPAGHYALHEPGSGIRPHCYYRPAFGTRSEASLDDEAERLRGLFEDAVASRLESEVPLGAFLSGGVDSSAVVAAMSRVSPHTVQAITVGFEEQGIDERPYARSLAERFAVDLEERVLAPDAARDLPRLIEACDEPLHDSSLWPTLLVSEAARDFVTVALSGDGGDESFGGYRRYRFDLLEQRMRRFLPRPLAGLLGGMAPKGDRLPRPLRMKRTLQNLARDPLDAYARSVSALLPEEVDELVRPEHGRGTDVFRELRQVYDGSAARSHGNRLLELDLRTQLPGDILRKVDRASMQVSLEVRSPLLDRGIVDAAASLPFSKKVDARSGKLVLKRAFEAWIPRADLDRKKQGFVIPLARWLRGPLRDALSAAAAGSFVMEYLAPDTVRRYQEEHQSGRRDRSEALWAVLMLGHWHERWGRR